MTPAFLRPTLAALCLAGGGAAAAAPWPPTHAEFADQVRSLRADFARSPAAVERAAALCRHLPTHRAADEPACVALLRHLRAHDRDAAAAATARRSGPEVTIAIGGVTLRLSKDA